MTCGGETGSAEERNRALCAEKGLHCRGTLPVVMPDNYIVMFTAPSPEESEQIIAAARPGEHFVQPFSAQGQAFCGLRCLHLLRQV